MRKSAIEQVRLEALAEGYEQAQNDAAYLFGALGYEQANKSMIARVAERNVAVKSHLAEHGEWVPA